jgi:ATP-binding cassette subfamily B protein
LKHILPYNTSAAAWLEALPPDAKQPCIFTSSGNGWKTTVAWDPAAQFICSTYEIEQGTLLANFVDEQNALGRKVLGYIAYDVGYALHDIPQTAQDDLGLPQLYFLAFDSYLEITPSATEIIYTKTSYLKAIEHMLPTLGGNPTHAILKRPFAAATSRDSYREKLQRVKQYITNGDVYQVNLTHRLESITAAHPRALFTRIAAHPTNFMAYMEGPKTNFALHCASPERFIRVRKDRVDTFPIKGPRGNTPHQNERMRSELLASKKDAAELNMITDLLRNDLGKVCKIGSVEVKKLRELMQNATVIHTFSHVTGELLPTIRSMNNNNKQRDKYVTREIHRLFWKANFIDKKTLLISYLGRIPAVAAYNIFIPLMGAYGIQAILDKQLGQVTTYAWWIIGLSLTYCVLWSMAGITVSKNAIIGSRYIHNKVFTNFIGKDYDFFGNSFAGSLGAQAARLRDAYNGYGELMTLSIPKQATIVLAGIGVIWYQSVQLALVTIAAMACVLSFTILSSSWRLKFRRRVSEASSVISGDIGDALSQGTTVKSFATESYEEHRLQKTFTIWGREQYRSWVSALPADNGRMLLAAITTAALLIMSAHLYQDGKVSITIVILVQLYVVRLVASTLDIAEIVKRYEEVMGAAYQPVKTMLVANTVTDAEAPKKFKRHPTYAYMLENVTFQYPEAAQSQSAVKNFSLAVKHGERIGLVGYSGSGKTTLTKLLLRFMDVTGGAIKLGNTDIRDISQQELRKHIAYVPQEPLLFHRNIQDNIGYGRPSASKQAIEKASKAAYVDEFVAKLPNGYQSLVGERGVKLSGGQRQRVAIARALLKDAPILVLDEATSALDSRSEKLIQEALWKLMKGRTALVIAHRLSTIQRMDRIVVMDKGRIVQIGTHAELLEQPKGIYAKLWAHQSGGYVGVPASPEAQDVGVRMAAETVY